jgi:cell division protease FtsH
MLIRRAGGMSRGGGFLPLGKSKAKIYVETKLKTRFEDVAGVDEAKEELSEIVDFLKNPVSYSKLGGRMPKGILLIGPPGTGKTLLARAVAGEAGVPYFSINGSEFVELFVGLGAARVRDLFEQARKSAPCILFIDELDALGRARGLGAITGSANDEKEQTLNQLLAEMDGFDTAQGIVVLAATNRPEILDPALLRAGRFDRHISVDKPDRLGREKILAIHVKKLKMAQDVDIKILAGMTAGFSGADLANLANEAALIATRHKAEMIELKDFTEAIERIVAGLERKNRLLNAEEKKRVAYHEMGHAVVALALGRGEVIHKVSIIPRGISALGYTLWRPTEDRYLLSKNELETKMAVALGGRASEIIFFTDISTGAGDDLDKATDIARAMVTRYGMDGKAGLAVYEHEPTPLLGSQFPTKAFDYSERTAQLIDESIQDLLRQALDVAVKTVTQYKSLILEATKELLEKETIDEKGLKDLWSKHASSPARATA